MIMLHNHKPPILHRDLKSPNLLVDKHWKLKVTDFNLSRMLQSSSDYVGNHSSVANNPRWLAPEVLSISGLVISSLVITYGNLPLLQNI